MSATCHLHTNLSRSPCHTSHNHAKVQVGFGNCRQALAGLGRSLEVLGWSRKVSDNRGIPGKVLEGPRSWNELDLGGFVRSWNPWEVLAALAALGRSWELLAIFGVSCKVLHYLARWLALFEALLRGVGWCWMVLEGLDQCWYVLEGVNKVLVVCLARSWDLLGVTGKPGQVWEIWCVNALEGCVVRAGSAVQVLDPPSHSLAKTSMARFRRAMPDTTSHALTPWPLRRAATAVRVWAQPGHRCARSWPQNSRLRHDAARTTWTHATRQEPPANSPKAVRHERYAHATERPAARRAPTTSRPHCSPPLRTDSGGGQVLPRGEPLQTTMPSYVSAPCRENGTRGR